MIVVLTGRCRPGRVAGDGTGLTRKEPVELLRPWPDARWPPERC